MKKLQLFYQNHGLSPLEKCQFSLLFKQMFILCKSACFLTRTSPNTFSACILHKTKRAQNFNFFDQNHGLSLLQKCQSCAFLKRMFLLFRKVCLLYKTWKIVFSRLFSRSMTWQYSGLQGVTGGFKGLQGVTRGYMGLLGVTRGERGWQGVTGGYKGL